MHSIYLAGPITGCFHADTVAWRDAFAAAMLSEQTQYHDGQRWVKAAPEKSVDVLSPMRGKDHLALLDSRITGAYPESLIANQKAIMGRDFFDCNRASLVVANLLNSAVPPGTRASLGTAMELAWCYAKHTPVIAIMDKPGSGGMYEHPMILETITHRVETLDQAVEIAKLILNV